LDDFEALDLDELDLDKLDLDELDPALEDEWDLELT
jgi:hypothetical protein